MAADVYAEPKHKGQGGWTWYTGSAGWMYQLITGSFIGLQREGDRLFFIPCIPENWKQLSVRYRYINTIYNIILRQDNSEESKILVDGNRQIEKYLTLADDGKQHEVEFVFGSLKLIEAISGNAVG